MKYSLFVQVDDFEADSRHGSSSLQFHSDHGNDEREEGNSPIVLNSRAAYNIADTQITSAQEGIASPESVVNYNFGGQ